MRFHEFGGRFAGQRDDGGGPAAYDPAYLMQTRGAADSLVQLGLEIVRETRGPMRLWEFAARLRLRLGMPPVPAGELCDAVKAALDRIEDSRLRVLAPSMQGVGYVYDDADPDSRPIRSSR